MTTEEPGEHRAALGRSIRELRLARGLTLREVAELLTVSPATLSAIENGRTGVTSERVTRLAEAFDVPVQRIFPGCDEAPKTSRAPITPTAPTGSLPLGPADGGWRSFCPLRLDPALSGALSSFLDLGYHGAPMRTIAERANLSVPGLYHYYASKQDMLIAILDLTMSDLLDRSRAARSEGRGPVERFVLLVECLALVHTHRRELAFVGASEMRSLEPGARERVAAVRREQQRMVDVEVEAAVRTGAFATCRPHEAARAVVTMCTALSQWFRDTGPASAEQVAAQYVDFALDLVQCVAQERPQRHLEGVAQQVPRAVRAPEGSETDVNDRSTRRR